MCSDAITAPTTYLSWYIVTNLDLALTEEALCSAAKDEAQHLCVGSNVWRTRLVLHPDCVQEHKEPSSPATL